MPTNIRVAVRMRPLLQRQIADNEQSGLVVLDRIKNVVRVVDKERGERNSKKQFVFDKVLDQEIQQQEVYEELGIAGLISKVVNGFHATIFAYGQTGSGKTFTMEGYEYVAGGGKGWVTRDAGGGQGEAGDTSDASSPLRQRENYNSNAQRKTTSSTGTGFKSTQSTIKPSGAPKIRPVIREDENVGITPRAIKELFAQIAQHKKKFKRHIRVSCSFFEIYNEKVYDLLNMRKEPAPLRIRWNKKDQFNVENLFVFECQESEQVLELFHRGIKNKIVASHLLNHASSRSHAIFTVTLEIIDHANVENVITSKLQLVDLAGSERTSMTGNQGQHVKESIDINRSLFTLRKVISGLADNMGGAQKAEHVAVHIPYRDSKLTSLLKQSLGGNSYCLMIACLSPSDRFLEENVTTLNYAKKASYISNEPIRNDDPKVRIINELRAKVEMLEDELRQANEHIVTLTSLQGPTGMVLKQFGNLKERASRAEHMPQLTHSNSEQVQRERTVAAAGGHGLDFVMMDRPVNQRSTISGMQGQNRRPARLQESPERTGRAEIPETPPNIRYAGSAKYQVSDGKEDNNGSYSQDDSMRMGAKTSSQVVLGRKTGLLKLDSTAISERLIESVNMVKDLVCKNTKLRETIDKMDKKEEQQEIELLDYQFENQELRDRIEILENVIMDGAGGVRSAVNFLPPPSAPHIANTEVQDERLRSVLQVVSDENAADPGQKMLLLVSELMEQRKTNRLLERRIKGMEGQNQELIQYVDFVGNNEPNRPFFPFQPSPEHYRTFSAQQEGAAASHLHSTPSSQYFGGRMPAVDQEHSLKKVRSHGGAPTSPPSSHPASHRHPAHQSFSQQHQQYSAAHNPSMSLHSPEINKALSHTSLHREQIHNRRALQQQQQQIKQFYKGGVVVPHELRMSEGGGARTMSASSSQKTRQAVVRVSHPKHAFKQSSVGEGGSKAQDPVTSKLATQMLANFMMNRLRGPQ